MRDRGLQTYVRKLLKEKPSQAFRIHTEGTRRGCYYQVAIFNSLGALRRAASAVTQKTLDHRTGKPSGTGGFGNCAGLTHSMDILTKGAKAWQRRAICGFVLLHNGHLGAGYVAHECYHAATYYVGRREGKTGSPYDDRELDERIAWIGGQLVADFWSEFYKRNPVQS